MDKTEFVMVTAKEIFMKGLERGPQSDITNQYILPIVCDSFKQLVLKISEAYDSIK